MREYVFKPNFETVGELRPSYSIEELEAEQGVYSATPEFVRNHCGPIANSILDAVPDWYFAEARSLGLYPNVDVRIHRLYPGDFPSYPGWHCDGQYRETYFSQPDPNRTKVAKHLIMTVSSSDVPEQGVSNTQFLAEEFSLACDETQDHSLWQRLDAALRAKQTKRVYDTADGELMLFDSWTPHQAMPARFRGWRLFFRMAMWYRPNLGDGGKLSRQEQVYQHVGSVGW